MHWYRLQKKWDYERIRSQERFKTWMKSDKELENGWERIKCTRTWNEVDYSYMKKQIPKNLSV
jgi:hypothetical protein